MNAATENEEILDPVMLNPQVVAQIFRDAFMEASIESDQVKIQDTYKAVISFDENHRYLRFRLLIKCKDGARPDAQAKYTNQANAEFIVVRVTPYDTAIAYDYYLVIEGGVTKRNIVLSFKRFMACAEAAINDDKFNVV